MRVISQDGNFDLPYENLAILLNTKMLLLDLKTRDIC